jgi:tetratricopeptide (TPR) repeat protein
MRLISVRLSLALAILCAALFSLTVSAAESLGPVATLEKSWAEAKYTKDGDERKAAFKRLLRQADEAVETLPGVADIWFWRGLIKASYADSKGGFGAWKLARSAKTDLETVLGLGASRSLQAATYSILGTLYYRVPIWPFSFGNDDRAKEYLLKGLAMEPEDIDTNYFYAVFLMDQRKYDRARDYFEMALKAPRRPERSYADQERRREIFEWQKEI